MGTGRPVPVVVSAYSCRVTTIRVIAAVLVASSTAVAEPPELDRPLTLPPGQLGAILGFDLNRTSTTALGSTVSTTTAGPSVLVAYGIAPYVSAGAGYSIPLVNRLGSRGTLSLFAAASLYECGKWQVAMSLRGSLDLDSEHRRDLELGAAARYRLGPRSSVFTGAPWSPGPHGDQLHLEAEGRSVIRVPIGLQLQLDERVALDLTTAIARLALPSGASATVFEETPFAVGVWIALPHELSTRLAVGTSDLGERDDVKASFVLRYQ